MKEIWKDIKGYEGLYEISNFGRVKSIDYFHTGKEKILKCSIDKLGYERVNLYNNKKSKTFQVHRLVAQAFLENPENKPCVNHLDCDPSNNCVDNLEWATYKENTQYASQLGRMPNNLKNVSSEQRRINGKKRSKPVIAINIITGEEIYFESQSEAEKQLKLAGGSTTNVLKGKFKQAGGYTFKYVDNK